MAKEIKMPLPSAADLFSTQEERDNASRESVREIPLEEISDFPNHPFKVKIDESMADMAESVKQYGVLVPALVREKPEGGYEMIAGHRRKMASEPIKLSGKTIGATLIGIVGVLLLGVGMCLTMVWSNMVVGIIVGIIGIVVLLCLIPFIKGLK